MQSLGRKPLWLALSASCLLLILLEIFPLLRPAVHPGHGPGSSHGRPRWQDAELLQSFFQPEELLETTLPPQAPTGGSCYRGACFDAHKCRADGFKVFAYPAAGSTSEAHRKILASLEVLPYHTRSPAEACLLLLLPGPDGCSQVPLQWNEGKNHMVLTLHPAPCPRSFQLGQAMVAEASPTVDTFRPGFDVALPRLPEAHPLRGGAPGQLRQHSPHPGAALLALAGERGRWCAATANSSARSWNGNCDQDPGGEQSQPGEMLPNATFCLIPGQLPDAWRFLQALQAGCIPVLLSPRWELPFSEVIDWTKASIVVDERQALQVLAALREMPPARVLALRQQTQFLWAAYFASVEKVMHTALEILRARIFGASVHDWLLWNNPPGALLALPTFSMNPQDFPFYHLQQGSRPESSFSALIWVGSLSQPPLKLIHTVAESQHCAQILILWNSARPLPTRWPDTAVPVTVIDGLRKASARFLPYSTISTDAVLSLDAQSSLSTSEVDFAFGVWQSFPERMVGFVTHSHFWNEAGGGWSHTAERANEFSMVLTTATFYHRYYHTLFTHSLPESLRTLADESPVCLDILMNFLVAAVTKLPPIKVPHARWHQEAELSAPGGSGPGPESQPSAQDCINQVVEGFGYMPLVSSRLRLDPVLFKDPVSVQRKKYRSLEKS
ncbi:exostosin-like 1 [Ochotona princeps]|uniref:exostosin-like 1 n=1 Tax=Ochotona princeps TaxID=9978 RepID=UPI00271552BC|nr:exostosin-like 1 [Ochotona princeps]